ncbi:NAD-dependent protein deacetylase sirtuin-3, mitochondrial isoform X3 [Symphalangus syndactylus]|uniref:NAD-dependent protein deacetylase sirtuin-3, mitochondrial isoform X3 n=1 Tax=Symphalangus syndactylus TaxID=9590 RepID=UPI0024424604|nr:NAD-dependent protein deacetylase sirtuin-3, mitochondrial isoform X3 [Symphalangus syndactylus]
MAFWGWRAAAAVRLWGRVVERAEAGGGVGPFQACGCRLVLGGRDDVSAGLRGSHGARGEPLDPARPLQRPPRPEVPRVFRRQPRAAAPGFFFSRSPGSGLYSNLQQYHLPYPEAIFELPFFFHNPKPFFTLAKELYPGNYKPNVTHYFLRLLHDKGLLLRLYTQNIDGLERVSGIPASKLVEAHGTFASATCTVCRRPFPGEDIRADVMADRVPRCPVCTGVVKPDIVFFGEPLPQKFLLHVVDFPMADLLLILGTSLEVEPFASLTEAVRSSVPRLLINRDLVGPLAWHPRSRDVAQLGDVVHGVERLVELLGWTEEMRDLVQRETGKVQTAEEDHPRGCPSHCSRLDGPDK